MPPTEVTILLVEVASGLTMTRPDGPRLIIWRLTVSTLDGIVLVDLPTTSAGPKDASTSGLTGWFGFGGLSGGWGFAAGVAAGRSGTAVGFGAAAGGSIGDPAGPTAVLVTGSSTASARGIAYGGSNKPNLKWSFPQCFQYGYPARLISIGITRLGLQRTAPFFIGCVICLSLDQFTEVGQSTPRSLRYSCRAVRDVDAVWSVLEARVDTLVRSKVLLWLVFVVF